MEAESMETSGPISPVALEFPVGDATKTSAAVKVPRRIRKRLLEARSGTSPPSRSVEEIEAKLKEADLRRQQFHEFLANKARPKSRSPSWSSQEEDPGQRLEAKLYAAEQKRLSLLTKAQMRLAKLDEIRQAAKSCVEIRYEKEREELETKVESRVKKAEANRKRLLRDYMQRRAAAQERKTKSLMQRMAHENKYKECVRTAIYQKRIAAEKKRMRLIEEEKTRVHDRVMQVHHTTKSVYNQREHERRRLKEQLETRLQRAKRQRAEYLRQRGSPHSSARTNLNKHGEHLSRLLARCWKQFVKTKKSTFSLAKSFDILGINEKSATNMPFEQLALCMESASTLHAVKKFLDRIETRFLVSQSSNSSNPENIDHLLKRVASPSKRTPRYRAASSINKKKMTPDANTKPSRYSVRVVLCAYMILGHPNAVFNGHGEREAALRESAITFVREFELLTKIILEGQSQHTTFRRQLLAFDASWRSYLYCFVVWKVKDARSLEDDLVKAACQLELSMMQTCKLTSEGQSCDLTHDMKAVQKQVIEDQKLIRDKVHHLSGNEGIERMQSALLDTRFKYFELKDEATPFGGHVAHITSPSSSSSMQSSDSHFEKHSIKNKESNNVARSLFGHISSPQAVPGLESQGINSASSQYATALESPETSSKSCNITTGKKLPTENELLVNDIVHGGQSTVVERELFDIKAKIKETMEKAFWEGIMDSMKEEDTPDFSRIVDLVKEVRDELCAMAPQSWKQEILDSIDIDILSQLLNSGSQDMEYLGRILEYALLMLQKLSAPAKEAEMKKSHDKLLMELMRIAQSDNKEKKSVAVAIIKGLRFVLEEIQTLKAEVSKARIQLLEPFIRGSAGLEYLQNAFADRYGSPSIASNSLPITAQWMSSLRSANMEDEWNEHLDSVSLLSPNHGLPVGTTLRTGSSISATQNSSPIHESNGEALAECKGEKLDLLLRLGLLKLASGIEGLTSETVPETFGLNVLRLRSVQSQLQQVIVMSTSMLMLRQILVSENPSLSSSELETIISETFKNLSVLISKKPDIGIEDIINIISNTESSSNPDQQSRRDMIGRLLTKSLQSNDPVFMKVSRSIYLAARAVVLCGNGDKGKKLAEVTLKKSGATLLLDQVLNAAKELTILATVSGTVHGPWYKVLM